MESVDNIRTSLNEIDVLLDYASQNTETIFKYQLFNKVSIVLLSTKLEVFIEEFLEEHTLRALKGHTNKTISNQLKDRYLDRAVDLISKEKSRSKKNTLLTSLLTLYGNTEQSIDRIKNISPSTKFNYGKHGQTEIEELFKKHGLESFIVNEETQTCLRLMNSLIAIRNNVIHQEATPSLTHLTVDEHKKNILKFIQLIENDINSNKREYYNE